MRSKARLGGRTSIVSRPLGILFLLLSVGGAVGVEAGLPQGRGVLLPLQDRVGEPDLVLLVETLLRQELETHRDLAETAAVRSVVRDLRIRDASDEPPDRLALLAERLGAEWFFLATLHEARQGGGTRLDPEDGASLTEIRGETPQVVLSARVFQRGSAELWWAGFNAASGRDSEGAFGLGRVDDLEELLHSATQGIIAEAATPREAGSRSRFRHRQVGFVRAGNTPSPPASVAVVPMDSVAELTSGASAEMATAALLATLDDFGFRTLLPGLVRTIRHEAGHPQRGGASRSEWEALAREGGANWVATGTVETFRHGLGRSPVPWIAFSVRFLDTEDGRIDWLDGLERTGSETASTFDRGRIYSSGDLTFEMMRSLFDTIQPAGARAGRED